MGICEQFTGKVNGQTYSDFVAQHFPAAFSESTNSGNVVSSRYKAKTAYDDVGCRLFSKPAFSPDINPIENIFNNVRRQLKEDAIKRTLAKESFEDFCQRVRDTLLNFSSDVIDKTIESIPKIM